MTPGDIDIVTALAATDLASVTAGTWLRHDGTPLTDTERSLVASARIEHLVAARELLVLDLQAEGGTAT